MTLRDPSEPHGATAVVDEPSDRPIPAAEDVQASTSTTTSTPGDRGDDGRWSVVASAGTAATVFLIIQFYEIARRAPIGHDEAIYLLRARQFARGAGEGSGLGYWASYRAPGLSMILSVPMRVFGESVSLSRAVVALFGAGTVVLTAMLALRLGDRRAAVVAPWVVLIAGPITSYAHLLLLDVPGAFFGTLAGVLLAYSIRDGEVAWWPALSIPVVITIGTFVRFGMVTNAGAILAAIVIANARPLWRATVRTANLVRVATVAALSGVGALLVLLVPGVTGSNEAPYLAQRAFRDAKGLSLWASYGDFADLVWPNGSRRDEAFTWFTLALIVIGIVLTVGFAIAGRRRLLAVTGALSTVFIVVGLNFGLGQMFGNYLGLTIPFLALLVAPGYAGLFDLAAGRERRRRTVFVAGALVAVLGAASVFDTASGRVDGLSGLEVYRATGSALDRSAPDGCGVVASYVQVAYYGDCALITYTPIWSPEAGSELRTSVSPSDFPDATVVPDQLFAVLARNGKRQPRDEALDAFLDGATLVAEVDHPSRPTRIYRLPAAATP